MIRTHWKAGLMVVGFAIAVAVGGRPSAFGYAGAATVFTIGWLVVRSVRPSVVHGWSGAYLGVMAVVASLAASLEIPVAPVAGGIEVATVTVLPLYLLALVWRRFR